MGHQFPPVPFVFGDTSETVPRNVESTPCDEPNVCFDVPTCSTAQVSNDENAGFVNQMNDILQNIGQQLADSIVTRLNNTSSAPSVPVSLENVSNKSDLAHSRTLDLSQVTLVAQGAKEPPAFKGDGSDAMAVDEWEECMKNFICKSEIAVENQADEIMVHLRGRARDIVRFGIRNGEINVTENPNAIFCLLRKHFGVGLCSSKPLADFYSTLPKKNEDPYEFWLRLNRAVDTATCCLKERGKTFDDPSVEVTRMFIRHCPDKELSRTFRSKTLDKWSARDVQEVLDEYHIENGLRCSEENSKRLMLYLQGLWPMS